MRRHNSYIHMYNMKRHTDTTTLQEIFNKKNRKHFDALTGIRTSHVLYKIPYIFHVDQVG